MLLMLFHNHILPSNPIAHNLFNVFILILNFPTYPDYLYIPHDEHHIKILYPLFLFRYDSICFHMYINTHTRTRKSIRMCTLDCVGVCMFVRILCARSPSSGCPSPATATAEGRSIACKSEQQHSQFDHHQWHSEA